MWSIWGLIKRLRESVLMCACRLVHVFDGKPVLLFLTVEFSRRISVFFCACLFLYCPFLPYKKAVLLSCLLSQASSSGNDAWRMMLAELETGRIGHAGLSRALEPKSSKTVEHFQM